mmetsp:Transcript_1607/g.1435  ORF Transcript_1607/g.1435 Transcript_1607/m.1435 type:complete len:131 (-) Transcript_1607:22-414(-)
MTSPGSTQKSQDDINRSSILLPNPLPKKKKKRPASQKLQIDENSDMSSKRGRERERILPETQETPKDWEEFKNFSRKNKGKSLQDRIDSLGVEIENNLNNEFEGQLSQIKQEILSNKRKSHSRVYEIHLH